MNDSVNLQRIADALEQRNLIALAVATDNPWLLDGTVVMDEEDVEDGIRCTADGILESYGVVRWTVHASEAVPGPGPIIFEAIHGSTKSGWRYQIAQAILAAHSLVAQKIAQRDEGPAR